MTPTEFAQLGAEAHAAIVRIVKTVVQPNAGPKGLVLDRDPVSFDDAQWLGALKSDDDLDENDDKRTHAWVVKFGGSIDPETAAVRAIAPRFIFNVEFFYSHDFGKDDDNSEMRARAEMLMVQKALADDPKLGRAHVDLAGGGSVYISQHTDLSMRLRLKRFGQLEVVHHGQGEIGVELPPIQRG
jgi:hypothetical protein